MSSNLRIRMDAVLHRVGLCKYVLLSYFFLVCGLQSWSQADLVLNKAYSENRISENAGRSMLMDHRGYLWVGTIDGLNRYDGHKFEIYHANPADSLSLIHNYISQLFEDSRHTLWVGTIAGLCRYEPDYNGFSTIARIGFINGIIEDDQGRIVVASTTGVYRWDPQKQAIEKIWSDVLLEERLQEIALDDLGTTWIGYENRGMTSITREGVVKHHLQSHIESGIYEGRVFGIYFLDDGQMLVYGSENVCLYDPISNRCERKITGNCWDINLIDGKLWANMSFDGVHEWSPSEQKFKKLAISYEGEDVDGDIQIFLKDSSGIIWGLFRGLTKYDAYEKRFKHVKHQPGVPNSISSREVYGLDGDPDGNLLVATQYGGVNYYDVSEDQWHNYLSDPLYNNPLKEMLLGQTVMLDGDMAWMQTDDGVYYFNIRSGDYARWDNRFGIRSPADMLKADDGSYWLASHDLYKLNPQTLAVEAIKLSTPRESNFESIYKDSTGRIWAGNGNGVWVYDEKDEMVKPFYQFDDVMTMRDLSGVLWVDDKSIWVGKGYGLARIDRQSRALEYFSREDGLPNDNICSILSDGKSMWIATNYGLSRYDLKTKTFKNFDRLDGLQDEIFIPDAAHMDAEGYMYFGGINGINIFHPDSLLIRNPVPPKLLIKELHIGSEAIRPHYSSILDTHISETSELELNYRHNTVSFELMALGYSQAPKNQYAYKMEGVDDEWHYSGTSRTTNYTGLPRGKTLRFLAKAANRDGVWTEEPVTLNIYITPPFWETGWFKTALGLLLLGLGYLLYRWRINSMKLRNIYLEREVAKKTREIQQQAEHLVEVNKELKRNAELIKEKAEKLRKVYHAQSRLFTGLSHEFRTPLNLLIGYLDELADADHPALVIKKISDRMKINTRQMIRLVDQLMDSAKLDSDQYRLHVSKRNLQSEIESIMLSFEVMAVKKSLYLNADFQLEKVICWFDDDVLYKVLYNLLSNSIKFTPENGNVDLTVTQLGDEVEIRVRDTGIGIPPEQLEKIFDRFYQVEDPNIRALGGTGVGLSLVKRLIRLHKGSIHVESSPGKGTTFSLIFPVVKSAFTQEELEVRPSVGRNLVPDADNIKNEKIANGRDAAMILVVEDNAETRAMIHRQLAREFRIVEAANGKEGMQLAIKHIPDLIISDVVMPEMTGLELCQRLKDNTLTSHIPIILLSALSADEQRLQGLRKGAAVYLPKPYRKEELRLLIFNQLASREQFRRKFLRDFSPNHVPDSVEDLDREFVESLSAFIEANLTTDKIKVDEFCKKHGLSRTQLYRKMKSLIGMSFTEFVRDYRLRKAHALLIEGNHNVSEIIYMIGFNSRSYFYESFKKKFGVSPSEIGDTGSPATLN